MLSNLLRNQKNLAIRDEFCRICEKFNLSRHGFFDSGLPYYKTGSEFFDREIAEINPSDITGELNIKLIEWFATKAGDEPDLHYTMRSIGGNTGVLEAGIAKCIDMLKNAIVEYHNMRVDQSLEKLD